MCGGTPLSQLNSVFKKPALHGSNFRLPPVHAHQCHCSVPPLVWHLVMQMFVRDLQRSKRKTETVSTKRQNCKHAGRQINLCFLPPTSSYSSPLSLSFCHTHTKDVQSITHRCSVALRPTTKEQMHLHRLLSWILIIHKVNWMCFLASWIFSSMHIKNETPPHFLFISSLSLSCLNNAWC